jgi:hypothetical protein
MNAPVSSPNLQEAALRPGPEAASAYLDLIKRCLTRYADGDIFLGPELRTPRKPEELENGIHAHQDADTMIGWPRLDNIQECVTAVLRDGVPGDLLEAGVWRGGSCIFMRAILRAYGITDRTVWVADSFAGFPEPDPAKYPADLAFGTDGAKNYFERLDYPIAVDVAEVRARFGRYGLLDDQVRFLEGFFEDTLPGAPVDQLALLRVDGDYYKSTYEALDAMYPRLQPGGFVIIDDLWLPTCHKAVDDYRAEHDIQDPIRMADWTGAYWRKTA